MEESSTLSAFGSVLLYEVLHTSKATAELDGCVFVCFYVSSFR